MIKILLVDDHKMMRDGLRLLLEHHDDMQVVAEASHGREAVGLSGKVDFDVVVMDVSMPELNGIETTRRLVALHPQVKVIALSMYNDRRILAEMLEAGAVGLVVKGSAGEDLVRAIRSVYAGGRFVAPEVAATVGADSDNCPVDRISPVALTHRELEVLQLVTEGGTTKSIGTRLQISAKTVDTHRQNIMRKLNLRTVAELTKYAVRQGITAL